MFDRDIFMKRLKSLLVKHYANSDQQKKYFEDLQQKGKARLPNGIIKDFAQDMRVYENTATSWLRCNNGNMPDYNTLPDICSLLNVSSDYLLGLTDTKEAYEDLFISERLGFKPQTIAKVKKYEEPYKELFNRLVDHEPDMMEYFLTTLYCHSHNEFDDYYVKNSVLGRNEKLRYEDNEIVKRAITADSINLLLNEVRQMYKDDNQSALDNAMEMVRLEMKRLEQEKQLVNKKGSD